MPTELWNTECTRWMGKFKWQNCHPILLRWTHLLVSCITYSASYLFVFRTNAACDERLHSNEDGINLSYIRNPEWSIICMRDTKKFESPMKMAFYELQRKHFRARALECAMCTDCWRKKKNFSRPITYLSSELPSQNENFFSSFEHLATIRHRSRIRNFYAYIYMCRTSK